MAENSGVSRETFQQLDHDLEARPRAVHRGNDSAALGEWSCSSVFTQKPRKTSQGGRIWPSKKDLQDSLPVRAEDAQPDPRSRGGILTASPQHIAHIHSLQGDASLDAESGAQSCCITWQTSPSFYCLLGVLSSRDRSHGSCGSALGEHWEPQARTGLAQDTPEQSHSWEGFQIEVPSFRLRDTVFQSKNPGRKSNPSSSFPWMCTLPYSALAAPRGQRETLPAVLSPPAWIRSVSRHLR